MKSSKRLILCCFITFLAGCAIKPPTTVDYDTNYDFSRLKSFAWVDSEEPSKVTTLDAKRQRKAIETNLINKGFKLTVNYKTADFLIKTHTVTDKKVDVDNFYHVWGYHPFRYPHWPNNSTTIVREYKVGTLVLDVVDPGKKQIIWRGSVSTPLGIYNNRTPEEREEIAKSNANHMLKSFPPIKSGTD